MTGPTDEMAEFDARLTGRAEAFEQDWSKRAAAAERQRDRRNRRVTRQFWFLFVFLFASFILLAYRTESTGDDLRTGLYQACQARVSQANTYNEGREVLIRLAVSNPDRPIPAEQLAIVEQQLRDGLLLPVEDCGADPDA